MNIWRSGRSKMAGVNKRRFKLKVEAENLKGFSELPLPEFASQNPQLPVREKPLITVVIPVLDGGALFEQCLRALAASTYRDFDCLVVDDGSRDGSGELAARFGATVLKSGGRAFGPAKARNVAARQARGKWLFFIDADVVAHPDTLEKAAFIIQNYSCQAFFGSYDLQPGQQSFLSQYRNLFHHYTHQQAHPEASTFWSGCGGINREVFLGVGGFSESYPRPSIEDIELGYRLRSAGYSIRLDKELLVTHLKPWRFKGMLRTDIRDRAIPWTRLILRDRKLPNDLNVNMVNRLSILAVGLMLLALLGTPWFLWSGLVALGMSGLLVALNWPVYRFFARERNLLFAARVIPFHWFYYFYSGLSFGLGLTFYLLVDRPKKYTAPVPGLASSFNSDHSEAGNVMQEVIPK